MKNDNTLTEQIEKKILQYINERGYQIGDALPRENEFAETLGVSRVVLREALSRLRMMGFIQTKRRRGTVLTSPDMFYGVKTIVNSGKLDIDSLKDLYELRIMLEIGMADFIFLRKTEDSIKLLENIVAKEDTTDVSDLEALTKLDIQFHSTLYKISGNQSLRTFQNLLNTLFTTYSRSKQWRSRQIISHATLVGILKKGTTDAFRSAMRLHLNTRFEDLELLFPQDSPALGINGMAQRKDS